MYYYNFLNCFHSTNRSGEQIAMSLSTNLICDIIKICELVLAVGVVVVVAFHTVKFTALDDWYKYIKTQHS